MSVASERLARTRLAILDEACGDHRERRPDARAAFADDSRWQRLRAVARAWWRQHPARQVGEIAAPLLASWARRHPDRWLALAAAAGALLVLARPWRLVSVTGLLLAALRSPQLTSMVMSAMAAPADGAFPPPERSSP